MNNPNWRRRGTDDVGPTAMAGFPRAPPSGHPSNGIRTSSGTYNYFENNNAGASNVENMTSVSLEREGRHGGLHQKAKPNNPPKPGLKTQEVIQHAEPRIYCRVIGHKDIPNVWPLQIIDVSPIQDYPGISRSDWAEIRPTDRDSLEPLYHTSNGKTDEQSRQLAATLQAIEETPQRLRPSAKGTTLGWNFGGTVATEGLTNPYRIRKDPHPYQNIHTSDDADGDGLRKNNARLDFGKGPSHVRGNGQLRDSENQLRNMPASDINRSSSGNGQLHYHNNMEPGDNRGTGTGDSEQISLPSTNPLPVSGWLQRVSPRDGFNPKAREFLSFSENGMPSLGEKVAKSQPMPVEDVFANNATAMARDFPATGPIATYNPGPGLFSPSAVNPFCLTAPHLPSVNTAPPYGPSNTMMGSYQYLGPVPQYPGMWNQGYAAPVPSVPAPMMATPIWGEGVPLGRAATGPHFPPVGAGRTAPPIEPPLFSHLRWGEERGLREFFAPPSSPSKSSATSKPPVIPKPRRPNPAKQQAYEEWVEWRKANEPGYAMECKLRQQRRQQRVPPNNSTPGAR